MNFTFKVIKNGRVIERVLMHSRRRFYKKIGSIKWEDRQFKVYLRVSYGKKECNWGCVCNFYNDGEYETPEHFWQAFNAFTEKDTVRKL